MEPLIRLGASLRFLLPRDDGDARISFWCHTHFLSGISYSVEGQPKVKAWFEDEMLGPLLDLLERGEGVVRSSPDRAFEARLHPLGVALHGGGDERNAPGTMVLTRDEAREIARTFRIMIEVVLHESPDVDPGLRGVAAPVALDRARLLGDPGIRLDFMILEDHSNTILAFAHGLKQAGYVPGQIWYSCKGMQDVTAWFEVEMLEPLLGLFESGEGVVRSSTSDLVFEAWPHPHGIRVHASGDDENDICSLYLTRDEGREIARATRILLGAVPARA